MNLPIDSCLCLSVADVGTEFLNFVSAGVDVLVAIAVRDIDIPGVNVDIVVAIAERDIDIPGVFVDVSGPCVLAIASL